MVSLGSWMNEILIDWGVDPKLDKSNVVLRKLGYSVKKKEE